MAALVLANAVLGALGTFAEAGGRVVVLAPRSLVDRLLRITIGALDGSEPGDLMARATVDTTLLRAVVSNSAVSAVTATLTRLAALVLMALLDLVPVRRHHGRGRRHRGDGIRDPAQDRPRRPGAQEAWAR